jgi:uncharacterized membrane protein
MEINGLPLHPLVVHAAVVFGPLAAVAALVYLVPSWRDKLRWPMVIAAVIAAVTIYVAYLTGANFRDSRPYFSQGPLAAKIKRHQDLAGTLRLITIGFAIIAILSAWLHARKGAIRIVLNVLLAVAAVALIIWVVRTGDAGAQAVWGS